MRFALTVVPSLNEDWIDPGILALAFWTPTNRIRANKHNRTRTAAGQHVDLRRSGEFIESLSPD